MNFGQIQIEITFKNNVMSTKQVNADVLIELLENYNIQIDYDVAESVSEDFQGHLSMMSEMDSYSVATYQPREDFKSNKRIEELEKEIEIYKNSVKQRINCDTVWIQNDTVMYE